MKNKPLHLAILGSGKGSNCRVILDSIADGRLDARVAVVASDNPQAGILEIAREHGLPTLVIEGGHYRTRLDPEVEQALARKLKALRVNLVVLAGYMRMVKQPLLDAFPRRIINIHPSLLPAFPGLEAWRQALEAGVKTTGCTVHYVDAGMDTGEIIAQEEVPVLAGDTPESLHARIQAAEHRLYPEVLRRLAREFQADPGA